jgi:hypothetical protein
LYLIVPRVLLDNFLLDVLYTCHFELDGIGGTKGFDAHFVGIVALELLLAQPIAAALLKQLLLGRLCPLARLECLARQRDDGLIRRMKSAYFDSGGTKVQTGVQQVKRHTQQLVGQEGNLQGGFERGTAVTEQTGTRGKQTNRKTHQFRFAQSAA